MTIRISAPKTQIFRARQSGFTLIEVLVVVTLIALFTSTFILDYAGLALKANIENSSRELATTIRAAYDEAILKGQIYRVAFDLDKGQYWVEVGSRDFLLRTLEQQEEERKLDERRSEEERKEKQESFALAQNVTKKKAQLPKGVHFNDFYTASYKEPQAGGMAYTHIFPHGFIEKTTIHLKDDFDRESTLIVNPVTGKSRVFARYIKEDTK